MIVLDALHPEMASTNQGSKHVGPMKARLALRVEIRWQNTSSHLF